MVAFGAVGWKSINHDFIDGGFVPYSRRPKEMQDAFGHFKDRIPRCRRNSIRGEIPDRCLFADVYRVATAGLTPPRCRQVTGSCVGAATFLLYLYTQACDIVLRGSQEQLFAINPYFAWGFGRRLAKMRGPGEGSFGGAQAQAAKLFGQVPIDAAGSPKPAKIWTPNGGKSQWHQWTEQVERALSWPANWPVSESQIAAIANQLQITDIERVETVEDYISACVAGDPPTIASMFGSRPTIRDGFLVGDWNAEWAHQMSGGGYIKHPQLGMLFPIDNQWGEDPYGAICPFYREVLYMDGSLWVTEATLAKILHSDDTECWVHKNTEDRLAPTIDVWDSLANAA